MEVQLIMLVTGCKDRNSNPYTTDETIRKDKINTLVNFNSL